MTLLNQLKFLGLNNIRDNLSKKGLEIIRLMGKTFRQRNSYDESNLITRDDFFYSLRELGIIFNNNDISVL